MVGEAAPVTARPGLYTIVPLSTTYIYFIIVLESMVLFKAESDCDYRLITRVTRRVHES